MTQTDGRVRPASWAIDSRRFWTFDSEGETLADLPVAFEAGEILSMATLFVYIRLSCILTNTSYLLWEFQARHKFVPYRSSLTLITKVSLLLWALLCRALFDVPRNKQKLWGDTTLWHSLRWNCHFCSSLRLREILMKIPLLPLGPTN